MTSRGSSILLAASAVLAGCVTVNVRGTVYVDRNGDGIHQSGERGVPGVVVAFDDRHFTVTDMHGRFAADVPDFALLAWARVPNGFRPGPVWAPIAESVSLGLRPLRRSDMAMSPTFVVAADSHATTSTGPWNGGDLRDAIDQALSTSVPPSFFTIVGDITQGATPEQFAAVQAILDEVDTPWVPVPGGHDWYDGGAAWRAVWGPANYSFDIGELHVVVWDTNASEEDQVRFFERDLESVDRRMTVIGLGHESPPSSVADALDELGVDYLFTGHWHANRRVKHGDMIEWGTQNLVMGTIDQSPSGYRVVTFVDGEPIVEHRARLVEPHLAITMPHVESCAPRSGFTLSVAASLDAALPDVRARVDCGPEIALEPNGSGGWSFVATIPPLGAGTHSLDLVAVSASGRRIERQVAFEVCDAPPTTSATASWPQLGGDAAHAGATSATVSAPLRQAWATALGGNILLGSPVVARDVVVVSLWDLGAGDRGGLVALDLSTGQERWRHVTPFQARSAPAIDGDTVVVALNNGEVRALALADGTLRWTHDGAYALERNAAALWGAPTIHDGTVYVALQGRMTALELATGHVRWTQEVPSEYPWLGSLASVTMAGGRAVSIHGRDAGLNVWNVTTGEREAGDVTSTTLAINATPVASEDSLFVVNSAGLVTAYDAASMAVRWRRLVADPALTNDWMYTVTAAPVLSGGRLFVPTQWRDLVALDAVTGTEIWRAPGRGGPLNFAHYRDSEAGYPASPVATGEILWVPRLDGTLAALDVETGDELWATQLGAPVVSAPAPAGDYLVVATFDGTVRAMVPGEVVQPEPVDACPPLPPPPPDEAPAPSAGCCDAGESGAVPSTVIGLLIAFQITRRRVRSRRWGLGART